MAIIRNDNKVWEIKGRTGGWNVVYRDSLLKYLNSLDPLFDKTKNKSEFEFILTLLRVKGLQDAGWDPWENTAKVFECLMKLLKSIKDFETTRHLSLWLYGHIVEASEPYEIVANLFNIIDGKRYNINNFPDKQIGKYTKPQNPSEKIDKLIDMANNINMVNCTFPFQDVFERELRNAIFHSDYALYKEEVRLTKSLGKIYNHEQIQAVINKSLAYFEAFDCLMQFYIQSYRVPKVIQPHPDFSHDPQEKIVTIIRNGHGVVGLKSNWTIDELRQGKIPFRIGRFLPYEIKMLEKDQTIATLPPNRIKKVNSVLNLFPKFISRITVKIIEKHKFLIR